LLISHQSTAASLRTENRAAGLRGRQGRNQSGDKAAPIVLAAAGGWGIRGAAVEWGLLLEPWGVAFLLGESSGGNDGVRGARKKKLLTDKLAENITEC